MSAEGRDGRGGGQADGGGDGAGDQDVRRGASSARGGHRITGTGLVLAATHDDLKQQRRIGVSFSFEFSL